MRPKCNGADQSTWHQYNNPFNSINTNIGRYIYNIYIICSTRYCGLSYFVISGHPQIWIVGDSIVRIERAAATRRLQLGTPYTIQWHGQGGARLEDVEKDGGQQAYVFLLPHQ